jgi:hypothetical protein
MAPSLRGLVVAAVERLQPEPDAPPKGCLAEARAGRQSPDQSPDQSSGRIAQARKAKSEPLIERTARARTHSERLSHDLHVLLRHRLLRG